MTLVRVDLPDKDKLETLGRLDHFREWTSLDETRFCLMCQKLISGREIRVVREIPEDGQLQLVCPTDECASIPMDWVRPTEEILTALSIQGR